MEGLRKRDRPQFTFNKDMKYGLKHLQTLQKVLDARATKKSSNILRRSMIIQREKQNYQLEYDRIRNLLYDKLIKGDTKEMLESRVKKLEELGAKAINTIVN